MTHRPSDAARKARQQRDTYEQMLAEQRARVAVPPATESKPRT